MSGNPLSAFRRPARPSEELERTSNAIGLGQLPSRHNPDSVVRSVCGFCSTGCSLDVHIQQGKAVNITPTSDYPVNSGMACPKGWETLGPLDSSDRATVPLLRTAGGDLEPVSWSQALSEFVQRTRDVQEKHGADSMAFLSTGQIPTEEMALLGAVTKFGMGIKHGDGNTRQCMATSVVAYKESFGFDAPPYTYADFDESDVVVLVGSNMAIAHPIMWERVLRNRHNPEIIVVDPRYTETAAAATQHAAIQPGSDLDFFYGLANLLVNNGAVDQPFIDEHTSGFDEFVSHIQNFPIDEVAQRSGLTVEFLERLAQIIADGKRVSFWWTMGVNQSHQGVRTAQAIINLALMTGNIGRPGTGANSVTGQCNAMGSRLFSNTTNLLGGYDFGSVADRDHVASYLDLNVDTIPTEPSKSYDQILAGIDRGEIKGLWVIATNTAHSWIDQAGCHDVLAKLDFLVVQDMYHTTETAVKADLVLPAAGWGEKDGTFINSERRIGHIAKVAAAPGQALADFWIFKAVAEAWGCAELFERWESPEKVFGLLRDLSVGQPCDFSGVSGYDFLDEQGGVQWPFPDDQTTGETEGERRLFADGKFFTDDARARFIFADSQNPAEPTSTEYPFVLLTGRGSVADWHTGTRTEKSSVLAAMTAKELYVEMNPADAERLNIGRGERVKVVSARGSVTANLVCTSGVQPGQVFIPMHFRATNQLTFPAFDPYSRQPAYKYAAVAVRAENTI